MRPPVYWEQRVNSERVGLFDYDIPFSDADIEKISQLVQAARKAAGDIHGVVLPELAMTPEQFQKVRQQVQDQLKVPLLVAGVGGINSDRLGTNNVAISVHAELEEPYLQSLTWESCCAEALISQRLSKRRAGPGRKSVRPCEDFEA